MTERLSAALNHIRNVVGPGRMFDIDTSLEELEAAHAEELVEVYRRGYFEGQGCYHTPRTTRRNDLEGYHHGDGPEEQDKVHPNQRGIE